MPYEPAPASTFIASSMRSHDASSASSKARPSGNVQNVPSSGPRAVSWPASPDSWPSSARIQAQRVSAARGSSCASRALPAATASLPGGDLLQLVLEFGPRLGAVDTLGVGRLDPVLDQRRGARA